MLTAQTLAMQNAIEAIMAKPKKVFQHGPGVRKYAGTSQFLPIPRKPKFPGAKATIIHYGLPQLHAGATVAERMDRHKIKMALKKVIRAKAA